MTFVGLAKIPLFFVVLLSCALFLLLFIFDYACAFVIVIKLVETGRLQQCVI
jgi:hypothetical protein